MTRKYSKDIVLKRLSDGRPYQRSCLNYTGVSKEGFDYLELISKYILDTSDFDLKKYDCRKDFVLHSKKGYKPTTKSEKGLCRYWYYKPSFDETRLEKELGKPIEYELNLVVNEKVNIDLISYENVNKVIHLIEAKGRIPKNQNSYSSPETLLRCALEIKTYYEILKPNKNTLIKQLFDAKKIDSTNVTFQLDALVPDNEFFRKQINQQNYPYLNKLLDYYQISVIFYDNHQRNY